MPAKFVANMNCLPETSDMKEEHLKTTFRFKKILEYNSFPYV